MKQTKAGDNLLKETILRPPYDGAKDYYFITDVDDREYLSNLVKTTLSELQIHSFIE